MLDETGLDSVEFYPIETELVQDISSTVNIPAYSPVDNTNNSDSVTISDEAMLLALTIVPSISIEEQVDDARFNMLIATQGGLVGPGGAMINIASTNEPVYAVLRNGTISIYGTDIYSAQNAYDVRESTLRMLEYVQLLIQDINIEETHSLEEKLMNTVNSLANVQGEMVGDPNYSLNAESLEEAFRNITTILIADAARVEYSELPDNNRMIMEARSMAEMFNNLLFDSLTKYDAKKAFEKAWSVL